MGIKSAIRKSYIKFIFVCITSLFVIASIYGQNDVPNVIIIISDDLNDSVEGMGGHVQAQTPNINRLIDKGVQFTNAHANAPICGPSRASLWTGMYPSKTGYYGHNQQQNRWRDFPMMTDAVTLMEHYSNNGYKLYGSGKVFHNGHEDNSVFNQPMDGGPSSFGPFPWDGFSMHGWGKPMASGHSVMPPNIRDSKWGGFAPLSEIPTVGDYTGWMKDWEAPWDFQYESEMDRELMPDEITSMWVSEKLNETHDNPFLIVAGMNRPHTPRYAPKEFFDLFPLETIILPPYLENDLNDTPSILWENSYQSSALTRFLENSADTDIGSEMWWKKWVQSYLACVAFVDHQVGVILDGLENSQYADNTIVIFTADHGYHMGEKNFLSKTTIWEESTRVPLVVYAPGVSVAGGKVAHPVSLIDLYPTLIDLSDLPDHPNISGNGHPLDGHSIRPFLENPTNGTWNGPPVALNHLHGNIAPENNTPSPIAENHHSVRSIRYRYTLTSDGEEEFYDHLNDPNEWNNLAITDLDGNERSLLEWHKSEMFDLLNISTLNTNEPTTSTGFNLYKSYLGPSNWTTQVEYTLPKETQVKIEIFNINGKKLLSLVNASKAAGKHDISFNLSKFSSGLYFCRMMTPTYSQTKKIILRH
jgi:iduronate 2-sulfatase